MARPIQHCTVANCTERRVGRGLCRKHYARWGRHGDPYATPRFDPPEQRFWRYVVPRDNGCWEWTGAVARGYGHFVVAQRPTRTVKAHRFAYQLLRGEIPSGLTIDHLCKNTLCVNPDHLEPVSPGENSRRANPLLTHCKRGHVYAEAHTYPSGRRRCRACEAMRMRVKRGHVALV